MGSGSTEAVVRHLGSIKGLLPRAVKDQIATYSSTGISADVWSELTSDESDVEHLVTVLDCQFNYRTSEKIRQLYQKAIKTLAKPYITKPPQNNLYAALLDYHLGLDPAVTGETLTGFVTLNYEDILERTVETHFKRHCVDYCLFPQPNLRGKTSVRFFKLHGSFNWENGTPIQIRHMSKIRLGNALWIPPGVDKRKDNYPFNLLWGRVVEELLTCDTLRIVGCSLSRNDWGLIPILYTIQRFAKRSKPIQIEIIDFPKVADTIRSNYIYLSRNIRSLLDMKELERYFKRDFPRAKRKRLENELNALKNPFQEWLEAKADYLLFEMNQSIDTDKNILKKLYFK